MHLFNQKFHKKKLTRKVVGFGLIFLFLTSNNFGASSFGCKVVYEEGSCGLREGTKGTLSIREDSLIFVYKNSTYRIMFQEIKLIQFGEKKESFSKVISAFPVKPFYRYYERQDRSTFNLVKILGEILVGILLICLHEFLLKRIINPYNYLCIVSDVNGGDFWTVFKIDKRNLQKLCKILSLRLDVPIEEIK